MQTEPTTIVKKSWREWAVPLSCGRLTLAEALADLGCLEHTQQRTPLIVRMIENPKFQRCGLQFFNGAVNIQDHDCIHILLGRGLLPKDEAFVIGFTMGSSRRMSSLEENVFAWISQHLYPDPYRLGEDEITVFRKAAHLGFVSNCRPLNEVDYSILRGKSLTAIRKLIGIEVPLLRAWYQIERKMFARCVESQRLLAPVSASSVPPRAPRNG